VLSVANTGMAVAIDVGEWNDIHPLNKKDIGSRLALQAEAIAYHEKNIPADGPLFSAQTAQSNKIIISFRKPSSRLKSKDGGSLKGFSIAAADGKFVWANAMIEGDRVVVWSDIVNHPVVVRYAWADNPGSANLSNEESLPASPFSTDAGK
jgi:sialate O-acetylesterase